MTDTGHDDVATSYYQLRFFAAGVQYYVAARLLFFAGGVQVAGNLAHHAVEMFLKGALCAVVPLDDLAKKRPYIHSLTGLWNRFKGEMGDAALASFDDTINRLHQFEDLRYPDTVKDAFAILFTTDPLTTHPTMPHISCIFQFTLRELDALVHGILAKAPIDPGFIAQSALNNEGCAALGRDNVTWIWTERVPE
jgi:hypothetical protein